MSFDKEQSGDLAATLSSLVAAGLPIEEGLRAAARELPHGTTAKALTGLADRLSRGQSIEQALADTRTPAHLQALVAAGLRSAALGRVLEEFVAVERHADDVHGRIRLALSYPALLFALMSGVFAFFAAAIVPGFVAVYRDFGADLPGPTQMLVEYSHAGNWVVMGNVAIVLGGWLLIVLALRVPELRTILSAAPLLGPVYRWAALARFARLLAMLIESGLALPQALRMAAPGCHDAALEHASRIAAARVEAGAALSDALASLRAFPESLRPMLRWGETTVAPALRDGNKVAPALRDGDGGRPGRPQLRHGVSELPMQLRHGVSELPEAVAGGAARTALGDALRVAAEMFEGRLEAQLGLLKAVVPPLTFLFVLWGALFLLAALMLPMVNLIQKLS